MTNDDSNTPKPTGKYHPACELLPQMSEVEFDELVEDIRNQGQRHAIIVDQDGLILDGRHRWRAMRDHLFMEPKVQTFYGDESEKVALVMSENIHRRHLTVEQRAHIAAELSLKLADAAKKRQLAGKPIASDEAKGKSTELAAKMVGAVSTASVERAKRRMLEDPEAHEAIKRGERMSPEERRVRAEQRAREREEALRALESRDDDKLRERAQGVFERMGITLTAFSETLGPCYGLAGWAFEKYLTEDDLIGDHRRSRIALALDDLERFGSLEAVVAHHQERKDRYWVEQLKMHWNEASERARRMFIEWTGYAAVPPAPEPTLGARAPTLSPTEPAQEELVDVLVDSGNGAEQPRMKTYTCQVPGCGTFEHPIQRGRPPKYCTEHRGVHRHGARQAEKAAAAAEV